jgi:hypothetical protein
MSERSERNITVRVSPRSGERLTSAAGFGAGLEPADETGRHQ